MPYHMIAQLNHQTRLNTCGPDCSEACRPRAPNLHLQEYTRALCGTGVVRGRDGYCSAEIAVTGGGKLGQRSRTVMVMPDGPTPAHKPSQAEPGLQVRDPSAGKTADRPDPG